MTDLDTRHPEFTIAIRGYDRAQVDEYVVYLQRLVVDAEARARAAEAEYEFDEHASVGPRIAEIFALADAEAHDLRSQVAHEANELLSEARKEGKATIDAAERAARDVKRRAHRDHETMLIELEHERARIRDEAVALEQRKAEAVSEFRRLHELLGQASGVAGRPAAERDKFERGVVERGVVERGVVERRRGERSGGERQLEPPAEGVTVEIPALAAGTRSPGG